MGHHGQEVSMYLSCLGQADPPPLPTPPSNCSRRPQLVPASPGTMPPSIPHRFWRGGSQQVAQEGPNSWGHMEKDPAHVYREHTPLHPDFNHLEK